MAERIMFCVPCWSRMLQTGAESTLVIMSAMSPLVSRPRACPSLVSSAARTEVESPNSSVLSSRKLMTKPPSMG